MVPTRAVLASLTLAWKLAIYAKIGAPGWAMLMAKSAFTPGPDLKFADFEADTDWQNFPIEVLDSGNQEGIDPRDGSYVVSFMINAGVPAQLSAAGDPRMIYGFVFGELPSYIPMASELLPEPISITGAGEQIWNPQLAFRLPINAIR